MSVARTGPVWWYAGLSLGLIVRVLAAAFVSNSLDLRLYGLVALDGAFHRGLYQDGLFSYPPLLGYMLEAIGRAWMLLSIVPFTRAHSVVPYTTAGLTSADLTTPLATLMLKIPLLAADAAMVFVILATCRELGVERRIAHILTLAWWLNPLAIFGSAINASWDVVVPLAALAALICARRQEWFASGASIALGVLAKLTPLYVIVALVPMAFDNATAREWPRRLLLFAGGSVIATALGIAPVAARNEWAAMYSAVQARTGTFRLGGANLWSFAALQPFEGFASWAHMHQMLTILLAYAVSAGGISAVGVLLARRLHRSLADYVRASVALLLVALLASPFAQPTYAIWVLPPALVLAGLGDRFWAWFAVALSLFASVFAYAVRSAQDILMPLCVFAHVCDPRAFGRASLAYHALPGPFAPSLQAAIDSFAGEAIGLFCAVGLAVALWQLRHESGVRAARKVLPSGDRRVSPAGAYIVICVAVLVTFAMIRWPGTPDLRVARDGRSLVISSSGYTGLIHVVTLPRSPNVRDIEVYFDARYAQGRGISATFVGGFSPHLRDEVAKRGLRSAVRDVDADALPAVFRGEPSHRALLVLSGILPETVRRRGHDPLPRWIASGGVVVWAGEPFDLLFGAAAPPGKVPVVEPPDYGPWRKWYAEGSIFPARVDPFTSPVTLGSEFASDWSASRLFFPRTTFAVNAGVLHARGGTPIAFIDDRNNSSVSVIPYGKGRIVLFADGFDDEIVAAEQIAQVLATGTWFEPRHITVADGWIDPRAPPLTLMPRAPGVHLFISGEYPDGAPFANVIVTR